MNKSPPPAALSRDDTKMLKMLIGTEMARLKHVDLELPTRRNTDRISQLDAIYQKLSQGIQP